MPYTPDTITDAMRGNHMLGIFLRIATDPPLHIWFGTHDIPAGFDSVDPDGTVYMGGGRLIDVPSLEVLINGTADAVEFTMSGVDPETGASALDSIPPVRGATVTLGITTLDHYYQPMSAIIPIWTGTASHTAESSAAVPGDKSPTMTLALAVVAGDRTRSRPARALWSAAHQKAIDPTDEGCSQTARLARGVIPTWPRYN